ncbi:MAG: hypothetical protein EXR93_02130 [Gemmatimonadetes bacterium]|nr:hypothetical protein [Gemmatimonadota bacterium]
MATTLPADTAGLPPGIPWYVPAVLVAAACAVIGVTWDISWHRGIGRDTFWTPAHMMIYASGTIAGLTCGWLVLKTTFAGTIDERSASVSFWGFRGPLGAWVAIWGSFAMVASAPFDNWWHDAYGLDVRILSPPHSILGLGFTAIELGALLMVTSFQNRAAGSLGKLPGYLVAFGAGVLLTNYSLFTFEYNGFPNAAHNGVYYISSALAFPAVLALGARVAKIPWPATFAAAVYMTITAVMLWLLEVLPATPGLAPVYREITHMVPPPFPIIMIVPAAGVDWLMRRWQHRSDWLVAPAIGVTFIALLLVTQWYVSMFQISPASENWFFGVGRWNYNSRPGTFEHEFWDLNPSRASFLRQLCIAALAAAVTSRVGLALGSWMSRVRR